MRFTRTTSEDGERPVVTSRKWVIGIGAVASAMLIAAVTGCGSSGSSSTPSGPNIFATPDGGSSLTYSPSQIQNAISEQAFEDESAGGTGELVADASPTAEVVDSDTITGTPAESAGVETATATVTLDNGDVWTVDYICNTNDATGPFSVSLVSQNS